MKTSLPNNKPLNTVQNAPNLETIEHVCFENVFSVPPNYFETLELNISKHALIAKTSYFEPPQEYYEQLSEQMANRYASNLKNPFVVPKNYFNQFPELIKQHALICHQMKETDCAEGYFEQLPQQIQNRIYHQKVKLEKTSSPLLKPYRIAMVTACFLMMATYFILNIYQNGEQKLIESPSANSINVTMGGVYEIDESSLVEEIDNPELIEIKSTKNSITPSVISSYLIENEVYIDDIIQEI